MQDGEEAFAAPTISPSFLVRIQTGAGRFYMSSFGPTADAQYLAADDKTQEVMNKTDLAMYMASEILIGTYIAAQ